MRSGRGSIAAAALALVSALPAMGAAPGVTVPPPGTPWDWQLVAPIRPPAGMVVFDTDPDLVSAGTIAALKRRGVWTICYVSVGTREDWRADAARFPPEVVGRPYAGWPGERFLDIRRRDILVPIMRARFENCRRLGFDAVEPDNIDLHENDTGFAIKAEDVLRYVDELARTAHSLGLAIGQKNAPELAGKLALTLDFALVESCAAEGWCAAMRPYPARGKPVFAAEYVERMPWEKEGASACALAARIGLSLIFKHRDLDAFRRACPGAAAPREAAGGAGSARE